jgi:multidrug/hemolysin transport system permease protein
MRTIISLTSRNIKVFLRDKSAVFFSLLSVIIIIVLYACFLGEVNVNSIKHAVGDIKGVRFFIDSWIMAGIIVVNTVTVSLGVFGIMIEDNTKKRLNGFLIAPISRMKIVIGYILSAWIIAFLLTVISFILGEIYIASFGGEILDIPSVIKVLGIILLNIFSSSAIVFFLVSFVRTNNGFATLSTILGTIIGFLTGIYIPLGSLPQTVQSIIKIVPASYGAAMLRQVFMEKPIDIVFGNAMQMKEEYLKVFGVKLMAGDSVISFPVMALVLILTGILFFSLSVYRMSKVKQK